MIEWGSFPRWTVHRIRGLHAGVDAGANMAALRIYLALALEVDFTTRSVSVSWTELEELTGLSRPMITAGLRVARDVGFIGIDKSTHRHTYVLQARPFETDAKGFVKVPRRSKAALRKLPTRGYHALDALKVYIVLLGLRRWHTDTAAIGHKKITEWTGVQPGRILAALDVLINHRLIHVRSVQSAAKGHRYHEYQLVGFSDDDVENDEPDDELEPSDTSSDDFSEFMDLA